MALLRDALRDVGVDVLTTLSLDECLDSRDQIDVLHLHWLEYAVELQFGRRSAPLRNRIRALRFVVQLLRLRRAQIAIIWTVHNLRPHEPRQPMLEYVLGLITAQLSDRIIVHSNYARDRVQRAYHCGSRISVIPHGNYIGVFPGYTTIEERSADIPFQYLCFGQIRPYKRLPELVAAFRALDDPTARLLIAGKPVVAEELDRIRCAAGDDSRVEIQARTVPDDEVSGLHLRADAGVFAYRDVFSSGALLLALSYGLPVVVPETGTAAELVAEPGAELYAPGELTDGLRRVRVGDAQLRSASALASAEAHPWTSVARRTRALYESAIRRQLG